MQPRIFCPIPRITEMPFLRTNPQRIPFVSHALLLYDKGNRFIPEVKA